MRSLFRLFAFAKNHFWMSVLGLVLTLASTAASLIPPYLTMPLIDDILIPFQNGKPVSWAEAERADIDLKTYGVKARGDVKVRGRNGVVLTTTQLDWDNSTQIATSQAKVRVQRKGTVLTGWGLHADKALQDVRILRDVQAEASSVRDLRESSEGLRP